MASVEDILGGLLAPQQPGQQTTPTSGTVNRTGLGNIVGLIMGGMDLSEAKKKLQQAYAQNPYDMNLKQSLDMLNSLQAQSSDPTGSPDFMNKYNTLRTLMQSEYAQGLQNMVNQAGRLNAKGSNFGQLNPERMSSMLGQTAAKSRAAASLDAYKQALSQVQQAMESGTKVATANAAAAAAERQRQVGGANASNAANAQRNQLAQMGVNLLSPMVQGLLKDVMGKGPGAVGAPSTQAGTPGMPGGGPGAPPPGSGMDPYGAGEFGAVGADMPQVNYGDLSDFSGGGGAGAGSLEAGITAPMDFGTMPSVDYSNLGDFTGGLDFGGGGFEMPNVDYSNLGDFTGGLDFGGFNYDLPAFDWGMGGGDLGGAFAGDWGGMDWF